MSEPTLISPLLDGFTMGQPMGEHDGVSCCPAIKEDTDKKYIVKIITIPATQTQMDALLLAGAYKDPADAMEYFRQVGEDVLKEAELLKQLSQLEGFLSYEGWQMVPITRKRLGYQVYLVGTYKRTLEKHLRKSPVTHLEAINLGLDLCAALSVCRQAGSLYVALKPANIFVSEKKQYRIGDLGFIPLDALSYTSLPKKYQSPYTPPELFDPLATLDLSADTYAVGMILYQLYNDGQLPFREKAPEEALPSPANADYELAEIIMKAINPDPKERWTDPAAMGKALASYMQRNAVNDVPITPHTPLDLSNTEPVREEKADAEEPAPVEISDQAQPVPEEIPSEEPEAAEPAESTDTVEPVEDAETTEPLEPVSLTEPEEEEVPAAPEETPDIAEAVSEPEATEEAESVPAPDAESYPETDSEFSGILAKVDEMIQHAAPESVVLPEIPDAPDPFAFAKEDSEEIDDSDIPRDPLMEEEAPAPAKKKKEKKFIDSKYKRRTKRLVATLTFLLALCMAGLAGFWYYQNIYLQAINRILINGTRDQLTVTVDTDVKESLLSVTCSDSHGTSKTQPLSGGTAIFTDLDPSTLYTIQLNVDGFHKLVGKTSDIFTTDATTNILSFTSVAGTEDGSVVLSFTVGGEEPDKWTVTYSTENEEPKTQTFDGHSVSISGLSVGKMYTFTLDAGKDLTLGGEKSIQLMASRLILAENLRVSASSDSEITLAWDTPGDVLVDSWDVRCYSDNGYDERQTVTDSQAVFIGINPADSYTLEVVASGMTRPARAGITANPIRIEDFSVTDDSSRNLSVDWSYAGNAPKDGWLLLYTIDGGGQNVVKCDKATAEVSPRIPGARYTLTLQAADGTSVLGGLQTYTCPDATPFNQFDFNADTLEADLLVTPEGKWYADKIEQDAFTDSFTSGEGISVALRNSETFYLPGAEVEVVFAIRDAYGNVLPEFASAQKMYWKNIWLGSSSQCGELEVPSVPTASGSYVLHIYVDGMTLAEIPFTIR